MSSSAPSLRPVRASDAAALTTDVLLPLIAEGLIIRRPRVADALDRADAHRRAIRRVEALNDRYGPDPALVRLPGRRLAFVLSDPDARRVLDETPSPFTPANHEKRTALSRFEPHGVLISTGRDRVDRRRHNERSLESDSPMHSLAAGFARIVDEESDHMIASATGAGLAWDGFAVAWWRIVRRIVLGDAARDDVTITGELARLRSEANWGPVPIRRDRLREGFASHLRGYVAGAAPGSLAAHAVAVADGVDPVGQIPQWLFAFDGAGMAAFRALALLDAHPDVAWRVRAEIDAGAAEAVDRLPTLRATVLESLRLWPTTPAILRDATESTAWRSGTVPAGTAFVVFAPYFHRNPGGLTAADAFSPALWLGPDDPPAILMPFSLGPARCPGRSLALQITSLVLARLVHRHAVRQAHPRPLRADRPLPATLSPFRLRFTVGPDGR